MKEFTSLVYCDEILCQVFPARPSPSPPVVTGMGHCPHMATKNRMTLAAQLGGTSQQNAGRLIGSCLNWPYYVYVCM